MVDDPIPPRASSGVAEITALAAAFDVPVEAVDPTPIDGRVHRHWRMSHPEFGCVIARVPRMSHLGLTPRANLIYLATAFRTTSASGATPRLHRVARVSAAMPWGALLVDWIAGRPPRLPDDLPAVARALGAIHRLPLPARHRPFLEPEDPIGYLIAVAHNQLASVRERLPEAARAILDEELAWAEALAATDHPRPPARLVMADTHPGNFRIRDDGTAILLDVERPVVDSPALDLAHASLPTSLHWDPVVIGAAGRADIVAFHRAWTAAVPPDLARSTRPWAIAYRRLVWLRTTSWACAWAARHDRMAALASEEPATAGLVRRLARFVDPAMMEIARAGWRGPDAFEPEELIP
ncbi:MAG: phosphotransferase [Alphaproteobacteria bacterium]|nr:phosphotransferase [Alphaproteobacteria bacterium]